MCQENTHAPQSHFIYGKGLLLWITKVRTSGGKEKASGVSGANEVKELILGLVCNAISSVSMQLEWKKTSQSKYSIGWLLCAVQSCWKVSVLMAMWVGGSLQPGTTAVHCCVRGFSSALSDLCRELATVKGFDSNCSLCSLGHVCSWT